MSTLAEIITRLSTNYYNSDLVSDINPGGMAGDGYETNFPAALKDLGDLCGFVSSAAQQINGAALLVGEMQALAEDAQNSFNAAQAAAQQAQGYRDAINPAALYTAIALKLDATKEATLKAFSIAAALAL